MATVAHTIYSHYDPKNRAESEIQPSQSQDELGDPWETESSFPTRQSLEAPRFVPATMSHEDVGFYPPTRMAPSNETGTNLAGWYRSLTGTLVTVDHSSPTARSGAIEGPSNPSLDIQEVTKRRKEARNKNNWFILRAIESESVSALSTTPPKPTLADILARDPPPLEGRYSPPVWLALGPSNKGYAMLQQHGWNEGEGLGMHVRRGAHIHGDFVDMQSQLKLKTPRRDAPRLAVKKEEREIKWEDDVQEIQHVDIIDLTHSDSEEEVHEPGAGDVVDDVSSHRSESSDTSSISVLLRRPPSPHSPSALLTPIATVLKSDRLGIGLKAKTYGPFRASQKRVTHGAAALAAHIKRAEDMRKRKAMVGRGHRGFAKIAKKEQETRQKMLAYLNE